MNYFDSNRCNKSFHSFARDGENVIQAYHLNGDNYELCESAAHGEVWRLFCVLTHEEIARDRQPRADAILHEIRARLKIPINNDFAAYYSRLFGVAYPALDTVFKRRKRTSANRKAQSVDIEVTDNGEPENEASLIYELTEIAHLNTKAFSR